MKPSQLGMLSALAASVCCLGPVLLVVLGLGSLGFGAFLGRYHWWFIGAALVLLTYAWRTYLREARRCRTEACEMVQGKTTRTILFLASIVVVVFVGLNVYTYASQSGQAPEPPIASVKDGLASVVIPVEGMTCFTCEFSVESGVKKLPGIVSVDAKTSERAAHVSYDPTKVTLDAIIAAINKTGYTATRPSAGGGEG